jgi:hypothetical protein
MHPGSDVWFLEPCILHYDPSSRIKDRKKLPGDFRSRWIFRIPVNSPRRNVPELLLKIQTKRCGLLLVGAKQLS